MTRRLAPLALVAVVLFALSLAGRGSGSVDDGARVQRLTKQLRCPVCEGLSVADSPSSTARAMAADVRDRVDRGESDQAIRRAYVSQYGKWILLEPSAGGIGMLVWLLPVALTVLAGGGVAWTVRRRRARSAVPVTPATRALVAEALGLDVAGGTEPGGGR